MSALERSAAERIVAEKLPPTQVAYLLATEFGSAPALSISLALSLVAAHLEQPITKLSPNNSPDIEDLYRTACVVAADTLLLQTRFGTLPKASDLANHWRASRASYFKDQ